MARRNCQIHGFSYLRDHGFMAEIPELRVNARGCANGMTLAVFEDEGLTSS
jgi:hypothetical protein